MTINTKKFFDEKDPSTYNLSVKDTRFTPSMLDRQYTTTTGSLKKGNFEVIRFEDPMYFKDDERFRYKENKDYIKRLLKRYKNTGVLKTHLILNHLTVLFNVFDDAATPLLFYNLEEDLWPAIKSFLIFLNRVPEYPKSHIHGIPEDMVCIKELNLV